LDTELVLKADSSLMKNTVLYYKTIILLKRKILKIYNIKQWVSAE